MLMCFSTSGKYSMQFWSAYPRQKVVEQKAAQRVMKDAAV